MRQEWRESEDGAGMSRGWLSEEIFEGHLLDNILRGAKRQSRPTRRNCEEGSEFTYRVGDHLNELVEGKLPVPILIRLHNRLVHYLLQLRILRCDPLQNCLWTYTAEHTFKLLPTIIFSTRNSSPLEM